MKTIRFLIILNFISPFFFAQELVVDKNINLKKGIYKDFIEFKLNQPSIEFNYQISSRAIGYGLLNSQGSVNYYRIKIDKKEGKSIGKIFGFCDGANIYVSLNGNEKLGPNSDFSKIEYLGRYCYYENASCSPGYNCTLIKRVIDITDGRTIQLDKFSIEDLIRSDISLYREYLNQKEKNKITKDYILKYSNKYQFPEKIYLYFTDSLDFLIYKLQTDSNFQQYYDRILKYNSKSIFKEIQLRQDTYGNDELKYVGFKSKHLKGRNEDYYYKFGAWRYFYSNGQLKELIEFDLLGRKNGRYLLYNENGDLIEDKKYIMDKEIN